MKILKSRATLTASALAILLALAGCGGSSVSISLQPPDTKPDPCAVVTTDGSVVVGSGLPGDPAAPELASGYRLGKKAVYAQNYMVVSANPLASKAGCDILKMGGNAIDAAVAVQMVLGLVEPQSSGIGGGAFMLYYDASLKKVTAYDGRETAPAAATENYLRWIDETTHPAQPLPSIRASGRSIGTPGVVRMLDMAHKDHGHLPWNALFKSGINLATQGFAISGRMANALEGSKAGLARDADAVATYFNADGSTKALGAHFTNLAYAATLTQIANAGAEAFYTGDIAQSMVHKIQTTESANGDGNITPGKTTLQDLANYVAKRREAVCTTYRNRYAICGMPPPSSGGIAVASIMGILENFDLAHYPPTALDAEGGRPSVMGVHLVSEAGRLAYADRDKYIADTDFVPLPGGSWNSLLNKPYLKNRAALIHLNQSMGIAQAGDLGDVPLGIVQVPEAGTTHLSIVDAQGNVVSMTTTVEAGMGSYHMTRGFMLNNQLTDFAAIPEQDGKPIANRITALKRPRSSMAPTLVFDLNPDGSLGTFKMATGSPGGGTIIQYVAKTLVAALDWNLDAQQATSMVDFGASNTKNTNVGGEHPNIDTANAGANDPLISGLRALGHNVSSNAQSSGIATIIRQSKNGTTRLEGGADPRREGLVLGDLQP